MLQASEDVSYIGRGVNVFDGLRDFWADTITLDKRDRKFALVECSVFILYMSPAALARDGVISALHRFLWIP
jgi:hypothetical protein